MKNLPFFKKTLPIIIIAISVILSIASVWGDSLIVDEVPHIGAGYSYLTKGDYRLNPEHPPLVKDLSAIPLVLLNLNQSVFQTKFWQTDINGQWDFGRNLIYNSGNNATLITLLAKLPVLIFFILSAVLIFLWSRKLYGYLGGLLSLIIFSFSPTIMAHARFVTTDVAAAFGILFATYFFLKYLKKQTTSNFLIASIFFGIALLTKFSTFLLVPFLGLLGVIYGWVNFGKDYGTKIHSAIRHGFKSIAVFAFGFIFVVWPVYYLHTQNYPPERQREDTRTLLSSQGNRTLADTVVWLADKPVLRAAGHYGLGLLMVSQRAAGGNTIYFLGEVVKTGGPKYFPLVYLIKEPLPWLILIILALLSLSFTKTSPDGKNDSLNKLIKNHFEEFAMILWVLIYWASSVTSNLNIGIRHLIPAYPFMIILVVGQLAGFKEKLQKRKPILIAYFLSIVSLLSWYIFENLKTFPHYLAYFNQIAGGPAGGHRYVTDSNLDWGQDLARLGRFVKENNIPAIELDYFGWADASYYLGSKFHWLTSGKYTGVNDFIARNQTAGWLAVSATFLQQSEGPKDSPNMSNYLWLKSLEPVTVIGHSIFVYHVTR